MNTSNDGLSEDGENTPNLDEIVLEILKEVIRSASQAFNMMTGGLVSFQDYRELPDDFANRTWDFAGAIATEGGAIVQVGCGMTRDQIGRLAASMMGAEVQDETILMDCLQELLNVILGGPVGVISKYYPIALGLPNIEKEAPLPLAPDAQYLFLLQFASNKLSLDLVLSFFFDSTRAELNPA